ncbi:MAG: replication-relaxation family protein [Anaerolineae bacterium]|nr:replication-relaxation family protein [Anaerolineae bacterium]
MSKPTHPRFTARDGQILEAIFAYDGVLADYQIQRLFFGAVKRTAEIRLQKLVEMGYITRPDRQHRAQLPGYTVYWLTKPGAEYIASLQGQSLADLHWRKPEARWSLVQHDIAVNDFRIAVTQAAAAHSELQLTEWIPSSIFWADHDTIEYDIKQDGKARKERRGVRPDSYFVVVQPGYPPSRFLLELDRATEHHPRFAREKLHAGIAYIKSPAYRQRFGYNAGRWLVVTTSDMRRGNMQELAERELGKAAAAFYYTTKNLTEQYNPLIEPIWFKGAEETPTALFESYTRNPQDGH